MPLFILFTLPPQITYLAAEAKANEHKLKAQWATSAANKRAAGAKYGFF